MEPGAAPRPTGARRKQLADTRTWSVSARIELLHQKGVLPLSVVSLLSDARKARNALAHEGSMVSLEDAATSFDAVKALLKIALGTDGLPLFGLDLSDHSMSDPFQPPKMRGEPTHWMKILTLPGEEELWKLSRSI
jgi:hypothetical protein